MERSSGAVKTAFHIQVEGKHGPGRPKMIWKQLTERDCREWKLSSTLMTEICGDLPCVQQASYLEGGPLVWMLPLYLHVNQKSDYDMMMMGPITSVLIFSNLDNFLIFHPILIKFTSICSVCQDTFALTLYSFYQVL